MQTITTISESMMRSMPKCHDWVSRMTLYKSEYSFRGSDSLFSHCEEALCQRYESSLGVIQTTVASFIDSRRLIFKAWKEGGEICENLFVFANHTSVGEVKLCYDDAFGARLLSKVCNFPSSDWPWVKPPSNLVFMAAAVMGAVGIGLIYRAVEYYRANQHVAIAPPVIAVAQPT